MKVEGMTKKDIKRVKREIIQEGILYNYGYMYSIFNRIPSIDLMHVIIDLNRDGVKFNNDDSATMDYILTKYIESVGYQEFKELLPYILG